MICVRYDELFSEIWVASAYKGATRQLELMPNVTKHYHNQQSWLRTIASSKNPGKFKGIAFTGWSRYDHMQSVCEILTAGLPSLSLCLQRFINYDATDEFIYLKAKEFTQCTYNSSPTGFIWDPHSITLDVDYRQNIKPYLYECQFPGSKIYRWLLELKFLVQKFELEDYRFSQILNEFNLKNNFFNTIVFDKAVAFYPAMQLELKRMESIGEQEFDKFYYSDLYEELTGVYITRYVNIIDKRILELNRTVVPEAAPNRPFDKISLTIL